MAQGISCPLYARALCPPGVQVGAEVGLSPEGSTRVQQGGVTLKEGADIDAVTRELICSK